MSLSENALTETVHTYANHPVFPGSNDTMDEIADEVDAAFERQEITEETRTKLLQVIHSSAHYRHAA